MKIVVAMDSFKGGLTAEQACTAVADGLRDAGFNGETVLKPMADGGEGTAGTLLAARPDGCWTVLRVTGPLPEREVDAGYVWFAQERLAVVEMALASGLPLLADNERNPLKTGTMGTGQLIRAATRAGAGRILLAIGGSATVDGGVGAAAATGWRFLNKNGEPVEPVGGRLLEIDRIVPPGPESGFAGSFPEVTVLCDVTNPLLGPRGAAAVFGPQKGAGPAMIPVLESGLAHLAELVRQQIGFDMRGLRGGGAAGGLGAGAAAFWGARLVPGIETVMQAVGLGDALHGADWCLTGEGSFDAQSLSGKVVSGVAAAAHAKSVPVIVLAGRVKSDQEACRRHGIVAALATHVPEMPMAEVMRREAELLRSTAARWLRGDKDLKSRTV